MKLIIALSFFVISTAFAGTCTTTTRSNYSANSILTSTALNADFNQLVTKANDFDGGCVTDGSLEFSALKSTDFTTLTNGIQQGCSLAYTDSNTISVGKCIASVNGYNIKTTAANTVTWGCSGCSSEVVSTLYYVYIKSGSTGTTLNLIISTTAPGVDGYDVSSNKIIGRFYNNASSNIETDTVESWQVNSFSKLEGKNSTPGVSDKVDTMAVGYGTTDLSTPCTGTPCFIDQIGTGITSIARSGTGVYSINLTRTYSKISCVVTCHGTGSICIPNVIFTLNTSAVTLITRDTASSVLDSFGTINCMGVR